MKPLYDGEFSTLKGEHELVAENVALKELLREYRLYSWHSSCNALSLEGDRRCTTCLKADALLKEN